jgi:transcription initiation factor IIE alpha subunit
MSRIRSLEELVRTHHRVIRNALQALYDDVNAHERYNREQDPDDEQYLYYVAVVSNDIYDLKMHVDGTLSVWDGSK